ncbi:YhdT family protein [Virgibacillus sp. C22-A2]|uniref:YhdT family protein n=1 Tax=Virgibacillus tibetensis TaxID=3042313 RepID=A0ABU6KDV8_9BACI|nr:YhdT family protein [Virgibacillus sp. C22-A2]
MKIEDIKEDKRFKQCNKEVLYTIGLFIFNIILVFGLAFSFGYNVEASEIKLIAGFPEWYFYGVIIATALLCVSTYIMVKLLFKDMSLDAYIEEDEE